MRVIEDARRWARLALKDRYWTQFVRWQSRRLLSPRICRRSNQFWVDNKNAFRGRRGFVIGNGPSLRIADLEKLHSSKEICIASNRIYLAFSETDWRPDFLTCSDRLVWGKFHREICEVSDRAIISSNLSPMSGTGSKLIYSRCIGPSLHVRDGFKIDQSMGHFHGGTVTYLNLQIAAHLGLSPIYIIGCDHYYTGGQQHAGKLSDAFGVGHKGQSNHFHPDYRQQGEVAYSAPIGFMNESFAIAKRVMLANGIEVFNATRGGHLDVFTRADFDDLF